MRSAPGDSGYVPNKPRPRAWDAGVKESIERACREQQRIKEAELTRAAGGAAACVASARAAFYPDAQHAPRSRSVDPGSHVRERCEAHASLQPKTIHATNRSKAMEAQRLMITIFFISLPDKVKLPLSFCIRLSNKK